MGRSDIPLGKPPRFKPSRLRSRLDDVDEQLQYLTAVVQILLDNMPDDIHNAFTKDFDERLDWE